MDYLVLEIIQFILCSDYEDRYFNNDGFGGCDESDDYYNSYDPYQYDEYRLYYINITYKQQTHKFIYSTLFNDVVYNDVYRWYDSAEYSFQKLFEIIKKNSVSDLLPILKYGASTFCVYCRCFEDFWILLRLSHNP